MTRALPAAALALALAGCATGGLAPAAPGGGDSPRAVAGPRRLDTDADVALAASLLRLEDRREHDAALLASAVRSANPEIRRRAALAAGRIADPRAMEVIRPALADPDTAVAASAAFAVGLLGDSVAAASALPPLLDLRAAAARPTVAAEAASSLGRAPSATGRAAVEGFLRAAHGGDARLRPAVQAALLAFWRFPRPNDASAVAPWLGDGDAEVRWRATYALARRPDSISARALFPLANDPDARVRSFVMRSLALPHASASGVGADAARAALLSAARGTAAGAEERAARVNAVRALGTHPGAETTAALASLLADEDPHVAITAAESLERLGTAAASAAEPLAGVVRNAYAPQQLRTTALTALAAVSPDALRATVGRVPRDFDREWWVVAAAARALAAAGPEGRAAAEESVRDADPRIAAAALDALAAGAGDDAERRGQVRRLALEALGSGDVILRASAVNALGAMEDPSLVIVFLDAYARARDDRMNDAALAAIGALGTLNRANNGAAGRSFLARFPRSGDALVRLAAAAAFGDSVVAEAWGPALPVETERTQADYEALVRELVVPELATGFRPIVRIETPRGTATVELFAADAPLTVENVLRLARENYFFGQDWPRVVPNFVLQGGDPRGDTSGGPGYAIRDEINRHPYLRGTAGMALSGRDTGGSQFFIAHSAHPHLDGGYTVFGRVTRGMEALDLVLQGDLLLRVHEIRP